MFDTIRDLPTEIISTYEYLPIVFLSYISFMLIFLIVSPNISRLTSITYKTLKSNHTLEWNNRFTSTAFSIIVSTISLYVLTVDHAIALSPLLYKSNLVQTNIAIVMGYILSDMTIVISNYKIIGDLFTLLHHCFSVVGYGYALTYSVMPYFANFRLICELSTPLVNMRWFLYAAGHNKKSIYFFINGITMTLMFFTVRIAIIPVYWYKVFTVIDSPLWLQMKHLRYVMIVTCVILDVINLFWFKKMLRGAIIVLKEFYKDQNTQSEDGSLKNKTLNEDIHQDRPSEAIGSEEEKFHDKNE